MWFLNFLTTLLAWLTPLVGLGLVLLALAIFKECESREKDEAAQRSLHYAISVPSFALIKSTAPLLLGLALLGFLVLSYTVLSPFLFMLGVAAAVLLYALPFFVVSIVAATVAPVRHDFREVTLIALTGGSVIAFALSGSILVLIGFIAVFSDARSDSHVLLSFASGTLIASLILRLNGAIYTTALSHGVRKNGGSEGLLFVTAFRCAQVVLQLLENGSLLFSLIALYAAGISPEVLEQVTGFTRGGAGTLGIPEDFFQAVRDVPIVLMALGCLAVILGLRKMARASLNEVDSRTRQGLLVALVLFALLSFAFLVVVTSIRTVFWSSVVLALAAVAPAFLVSGSSASIKALERWIPGAISMLLPFVALTAVFFACGTYGVLLAAVSVLSIAPFFLVVRFLQSIPLIAEGRADTMQPATFGGEFNAFFRIMSSFVALPLFLALPRKEFAISSADATGTQQFIMLVLGGLFVFVIAGLVFRFGLLVLPHKQQGVEQNGIAGGSGREEEGFRAVCSRKAKASAGYGLATFLIIVLVPLAFYALAGLTATVTFTLGVVVIALLMQELLDFEEKGELPESAVSCGSRMSRGGVAPVLDSLMKFVPLLLIAVAVLL